MANIKTVLRYGKNYIDVEMDDGSKLRRIEGTVAWRCRNRGNVKFGDFAKKYGAVGRDYIGHAVFPTVEMGDKARYSLLFDQTTRYYSLTLFRAISIYAPEDDGNDPNGYTKFLCKGATYDKDTVLNTMTEEQRQYLLERMALMEGYQVGRITQL